jgi:hypothetical protein
MPHAFDGVDLDVVASATGDRDVAGHVLQVERAVASEPDGAGEVLGVFRSSSAAAAAPALRLEPLFDKPRESIGLHLDTPRPLIGLLLDVSGDLIDLTLDATRDVFGQFVPIAGLLRSRDSRHGDEDKGDEDARDEDAALDSAH